jgi:acyl-CoA reductase-like NAD-dependent aldehyde dehydrogenase
MTTTPTSTSTASNVPVSANRIGGRSVPHTRTTPLVDPATLEVIAHVPHSTSSDIDAAVTAAHSAAAGWAATAPQERSRVLLRWAELLLQHKEELAALATSEMGKLLKESRGEVDRAVSEIQFMSGEALRLNGETFPSATPGTLIYTTRIPVGTVAAITPWNFPIVAPVRKIAPALAAGNTVIVKPAAESPLSTLLLVDLLQEAGLLAGVVNVVCGSGREVGAALVAHPGVDAITFTGSTQVGRTIAEAAGRRLVPTQLELGGKNAVYVDVSADLDRAVPEIVSASIQATGQRCTAISRVIAHEAIADELVLRLAAAYDGLLIGSGREAVDVGPLVSEKARDDVAAHLRAALEEGARSATFRRDAPEGAYLAPVVLDGVTPTMAIARDEVFGPVLSVLRVAGHEEAIEVANSSEYGLAAAAFASDIRVTNEFAHNVRAGMVHINHGTASQAHVPFGGVGASGLGPYSIGHSVQDFFTQVKAVYVKS